MKRVHATWASSTCVRLLRIQTIRQSELAQQIELGLCARTLNLLTFIVFPRWRTPLRIRNKLLVELPKTKSTDFCRLTDAWMGYTYVHKYIYAYTLMNTHTHIHTYIYSQRVGLAKVFLFFFCSNCSKCLAASVKGHRTCLPADSHLPLLPLPLPLPLPHTHTRREEAVWVGTAVGWLFRSLGPRAAPKN